MTYQPVVPMGGLVGWRYLSQTLDRQMEAFSASPTNQRDTAYFAEQIPNITTAEELVADRRLLRVALGAFGLQEDINSSAFIRKVLEDGTESRSALANRLADDRYAELARSFGFGDTLGARTADPGFAGDIVNRFQAAQFEVAIGNQDEDMRLALNAERELSSLVERSVSEDTKWFLILGTPPLRTVFETALALPKAFGQIDIEQQAATMKELMAKRMDIPSIDDLGNAETRERFVEQFLLKSQISDLNASASSQSIALTLLQSVGPSPSMLT